VRLRYLNISGNPLGALPERIGDMRGLLELRAERCGLTTLPELPDVCELALPALDKLDLRWNRDLAEPAWLGELAGRGCVVWR